MSDLSTHAISVVSGNYYSGNLEEQEKVKELEARTILEHADVRIHDSVVIDYGPGFGTMLNLVRSMGGHPIGVEIDAKMAEFQRSRTDCSILHRPDGRFDARDVDLVVNSGVMIHMTIFEIRRFAEDCARCLRPGGVLMFNCFDSRSFFKDSTFTEFFMEEEARAEKGHRTIQQYVDLSTVVSILSFYGIHTDLEKGMSVISGCYKAVRV